MIRCAETLQEAIGLEIVRHRKLAGFDQHGFATRLGVSPSSLSKIENGKQQITIGQLFDLCEALSVDPVNLLRAAQQKSPHGAKRRANRKERK